MCIQLGIRQQLEFNNYYQRGFVGLRCINYKLINAETERFILNKVYN